MKDTDVIESLNNAWRALCRRYNDIHYRNETTRNALNLLSGIIGEVERQVKESNTAKQMTIEEWLDWLEKEEEADAGIREDIAGD